MPGLKNMQGKIVAFPVYACTHLNFLAPKHAYFYTCVV